MTAPSLTPSDIAVVAAVNDDACLRRNLAASPAIAEGGLPLHVETGAPSAAVAYNRGLDATDAALVVFAHQDVYLPRGWERRLLKAVTALEARDPDWALLGPFGMSAQGEHMGRVWSTSLGQVVGAPSPEPTPVQSYDELLFVMRRDAGLRFDETLPGWHMYGTDIVQTALAAGRGAWVMDLPCVHNDGFHDMLRADFSRAYHFVRRKWRARLPFRTPVLWVSRHGLHMPLQQLRMYRSMAGRRARALDPDAPPQDYARRCGWES